MADINEHIDPEKRELSTEDMVKGIGRKATDDELRDYLLKDIDAIPLSFKDAFAKYDVSAGPESTNL